MECVPPTLGVTYHAQRAVLLVYNARSTQSFSSTSNWYFDALSRA